ncbi:MAG: hypothetical protein EU531_00875 [Promethearchaeota archaeon]|nr:MAG: hypothetical protein EU531_00875 [Candidatus Lokiarchaeota archaeon]
MKEKYQEVITIEIINILGKNLATNLNISPPAARGLIKLSIKDQFGPFKPLSQLSYEDLKLIINQSLKKRLLNLEVVNLRTIINIMLEDLKKNQSVITMAGV